VYRRALLATLIFAGPRIGELTALNWRDIDLTAGHIHVRAAKTAAGVRQIDLLPTLRDMLSAHKARVPNASPEAFVFPSAKDTQMSQESIRDRVPRPAVANANMQLIRGGNSPLQDGLTPHKLRHTFASILIAVGVDPGGHSDPGFTLRLYRHSMRRNADARASLLALVGIKQVEQAVAR
jgi:integrase